MVQYANAPILLQNLLQEPEIAAGIFRQNAPYSPLGGWFRPDQSNGESGDAMSPMWFQKDWVHAEFSAEGSDVFFHHEKYLQAARDFYDAEVVVPRTIYVNLMAAMAESGPAHTDNPIFHGRDRTNTPMLILRTMLWSGLFDDWMIHQATAIWWLNDVAGGGLKYWPEGEDKAPQEHVGAMANTALIGDNHRMFHQVGPVGPVDKGTRLVNANAHLAPSEDDSGDWEVTHKDEIYYRAPFNAFRASVLWKADVYATEEERQRAERENLSLAEVARVFNEDLKKRGEALRFDLEQLEDASLAQGLAQIYPEPVPMHAGESIFDAYYK